VRIFAPFKTPNRQLAGFWTNNSRGSVPRGENIQAVIFVSNDFSSLLIAGQVSARVFPGCVPGVSRPLNFVTTVIVGYNGREGCRISDRASRTLRHISEVNIHPRGTVRGEAFSASRFSQTGGISDRASRRERGVPATGANSHRPREETPKLNRWKQDFGARTVLVLDMTRRTAKRGQYVGQDFLGCTRYPACRGIREVDGTSAD
jgi:hypothetical protein